MSAELADIVISQNSPEPNDKIYLHDRDVLTIGPWTFIARTTTDDGDSEQEIPELPPPPPTDSKDPYQTSASMLLRLRADGTLDRQVGWNFPLYEHRDRRGRSPE